MTALVPRVPVKAGCFGRSVLTHLRLDTLFVLEKFSQMSDSLVELHRGLCKTVAPRLRPVRSGLSTLNLFHQQQSPSPYLQPAGTLKGNLSPSGNQSMCYIQHKNQFEFTISL